MILYIALRKTPKSFPPRPLQHGTTMAARIGAANVQGVRKGDLANRRREDSPIYSLFRPRSTLLHRLQTQLGV